MVCVSRFSAFCRGLSNAFQFQNSFELAAEKGLATVLHAGEAEGAKSIWSALELGRAVRIGHGIRCLEDANLIQHLREKQIPLEVCPSSNVCLRVVKDLESHPLPKLLSEGLYVTVNTDDPPMFDTTLNDELVKVAKQFGFSPGDLRQLTLNALRAALLPSERKASMEKRFETEFDAITTRSMPHI